MLVSFTHDFILLTTRDTEALRVELALEKFCMPMGTPPSKTRGTTITKDGIVGERGVQRSTTSLGRILTRSAWRVDSPATAVRRKVGRSFWDGATKLTVVRNPFERMVAMYYRMVPRPVHPRPNLVDLKAEFRDFLLHASWENDREIVYDGKEFAIDAALEYESLEEDFDDLIMMLDLPVETRLAPEDEDGPIIHYDIPEFYDAASISCVQTRLAWVFENFDYPDTPVPRARRAPPVTRSTLI